VEEEVGDHITIRRMRDDDHDHGGGGRGGTVMRRSAGSSSYRDIYAGDDGGEINII
jgi:hypothetical protein